MANLAVLTVREENADTSVIDAVGEIDLTNCSLLDQAISSLTAACVIVDMSLCTFFDSSCISVLVRHAKTLSTAGKRFIVRVDEHGRKIIELMQLAELLGVEAAATDT